MNLVLAIVLMSGGVLHATEGPDAALPPTQLGVYYWGALAPADKAVAKGRDLAGSLGVHVVRLLLSGRFDHDYKGGGDCIPGFTLKGLASRSDYRELLNDPRFTTVILTTYDGASWADCATKHYLEPGFFTPENTKRVSAEYTELAAYLKGFPKTFIIDAWEGDNDVYCGRAWDVAMNGFACDGVGDRLEAYRLWMQARIAGIRAANAPNVKSAVEFNILHALEDHKLPCILNDVVPRVDADYYSYSSYESITPSADQAAKDIDYLRGKLKRPQMLFLGEAGFPNGESRALAAARLSDTFRVAQQKNIPFVVVWDLTSPDFGAFNGGDMTPIAKALLHPPSPDAGTYPLAGAQGFDATTKVYTGFWGHDDQFLILYGKFAPKGNTVLIDNIAFTPAYESEFQINVKLDHTVLAAPREGLSVAVVVQGPDGKSSSPVQFTLMPPAKEADAPPAAR